MLQTLKQPLSITTIKEDYKVESIALVLLLGFELSYYLLIVQTGITQYFNSDLIALFPLFLGGVAGTILSGQAWGIVTNPIHKILFALSLQLGLSFLYPDFSAFSLGILGVSVGMMAPLSIYIFKQNQRIELFLALAIAYSVGTYFFTSFAESRDVMAVVFTVIALVSAVLLIDYKVEENEDVKSRSFMMYLPLMLWILLDSNLFETISRHINLDIWSEYTYTIITFHIIDLLAASKINISISTQHKVIALLFVASYAMSYLEFSTLLAVVYPFTISYYNIIVFTSLSKELSLARLSLIMIFVGWIASGLGLALALSHLLH